MAQKHTYKPTSYRLEPVCAREPNNNGSSLWRHKKRESMVLRSSRHFEGTLHIGPLICIEKKKGPKSPRNLLYKRVKRSFQRKLTRESAPPSKHLQLKGPKVARGRVVTGYFFSLNDPVFHPLLIPDPHISVTINDPCPPPSQKKKNNK